MKFSFFGGAVFFIFFLLTQPTQAQSLEYGFLPPDELSIPQSVREKSKAIFKIDLDYMAEIPRESYDFFIDRPQASAELKASLIECRSRDLPICWAPLGKIQGSAFLGQEPDTLWTNCHIVRSWMEASAGNQTWTKSSEVYSFYKNKTLPLRLSQINQEVIYDGANENTYIEVFSPSKSLEGYTGGCNAMDDLVRIRLARPLAETGLLWSKVKRTDDEALYLGGFPKPTNNRETLGGIDSLGESFRWTRGPYLNKRSSLSQEYLNRKDNIDFAISGPYLELVLSDGVEGMSGGPVLNQLGEVTGIYRGYLPEETDLGEDIPFVSMFFSTNGMRFLEILSL